MKKKVTHTTVDKDEAARRKQVLQALITLTDSGVVEWRVGNDLARAGININLDKFVKMHGIERYLSIANNHTLNDCGDPDEESFDLGAEEYSELELSILTDMSRKHDYAAE